MLNDIIKLGVVLLLVLANGFFVAVEFALVSVRRPRIEVMAAAGKSGAQAVIRALDHLDEMLSASQFGITLASLALGAVGESTLAHLLEPVFAKYLPGGVSDLVAHSIAVAVALAVITYLHLVLGEYAPKAMAIEKAEAIAIATARPLYLFYRAFKPFILFINVSGIRLLKLFGVDFRPGHHTVYTEDELRHLIEASHLSGHLQFEEKTLIHNVFDFSDLTAREIMVARAAIVAIERNAGFLDVVQKFEESGYSRLPVYRENLDNIVGTLHSKNVMRYLLRPEEFDLETVMHAPTFIPDTARLGDVMARMQRERAHLAIVVDEHSGVEGILTLEDLLEEIVGEIEDEHDELVEAGVVTEEERTPSIFILDAGLTVRDANRKYKLKIPESDAYNTVAGFLIARAGRLLEAGDAIEYDNSRFTVERIERRRITHIRVEHLPAPELAQTASVEAQ